MNELTLTVLRLGFLVVLWLFIFAVTGALRGDLYGTQVRRRRGRHDTPAQGYQQVQPSRAPLQRRREPRKLVVTAGSLAGTSLPLREAGTLIGRSPECALVLDDDYASGRHCRIYRGDDSWVVEDLGSTNGTFLGTQRLHGSAPVDIGAQLRIGRTVIELQR